MDGITTTTVVNSDDLIQAVRESAMLAHVSISTWAAEKTDRTAMETLKQTNGATGDVGRVVKNMLAGADKKLKEVISAYNQVRSLHYSYTLPWTTDPHAERQRGPRLLPHLLFQDYLTALSKQKRAAEQMLDGFLADYPSYVAQARANLGGLADAKYPTEDEVRASFRVHFDFEPLPVGASFKGLPEHAIERLSKALTSKQERMIADAQKAMWAEARERVEHIVGRLADPENKFKASTVENVRELVTLLPGWNLTKNPEVDEIAADIEKMLQGIDAKQIRDSATTRSDVVSKAQAIADKLSRWGV